ncbi:RDD family protein [Agrococcus citreus]|uniref:RDD family protein n=1 Tax=Agrococcus citreus TaxID=84643 RepID=A0ABP4JP17_9MICO
MTTPQPPSSQSPGWYPDPYAATDGVERWWNGIQWLAETRDPAAALAEAPAAPVWAPAQPAPSRASTEPELASWGARVAAYLLDLVPFVVLVILVLGSYGWFDLVGRASEGDEAAFAELEAMSAPGSPGSVASVLIGAIAYFAYSVGFHVRKGATPGKMLVGIRVRMLEEDRHPDLRAAVLRWAVQQGGPQLLSTIAGVGFFAGVFSIVDHVWPLWDPRRQSLHDKVARTIVVRAPRGQRVS